MLGLIVSIYEDLLRAFKDAEEYGCECIQIPASPWTIPNATEEEAAIKFRETWNGSRVKVIVAHVYSGINLASRNDELRQKYISVLTDEINRCDKFGISLVVLHPGHNPFRREGMNLLIEGLNQVLSSLHASKIQILLETMPGGKGCLVLDLKRCCISLRKFTKPNIWEYVLTPATYLQPGTILEDMTGMKKF